jgi:glyoxylase-like metal-dependent hydrolase (beta-lactamase superfamily II)
VRWILETHAHADHLSAAQHLHEQLGGEIAIGRGILRVQRTFKELFHLGAEFEPDGRQFDRLLDDDESLPLGSELAIHVIATPGHTNDSVTYVIGDAVFVGDTLFMPDSGSARCDFPGGDAVELYRSVRWMYTLPPATRMFLCHDYAARRARARGETTIAAQRAGNIHIRDGVSEQAFVQMRTRRDATLDVPNLIIPAVQVNIRAGRLPPPEANGVSYLRVPLNLIGRARDARRCHIQRIARRHDMTNITQARRPRFGPAWPSGEILLVDVREPNEYAFERIHGALLYPLSTFDAQAVPAEGRKTRRALRRG